MSDSKPSACIDCRFCGAELTTTFCNLGMSPISNAFIKQQDALKMEPHYPLHVFVCSACYLVQLPTVRSGEEIFDGDYAYFSSFSPAWLAHAATYVDTMLERFPINQDSFVVEIASNDGYLLKNFVARGIPVLGVEPTANTAAAAEKLGVPSLVKFFGVETARELTANGRHADLLLGNNVLAHVPDLNDFVAGMQIMLAPQGVITMEFPHLLRLMEFNQFDTVYHEHYSYLSLLAVDKVFKKHGLEIFDVEELWTHGGSLRIYAHHQRDATHSMMPNVQAVLDSESASGLDIIEGYQGFEKKVTKVKRDLLRFLIQAQEEGKTVAAYGAPAKGNTLLNYCGVGPELLSYTVDMSPHKQGTLLPGVHIPVHHPDVISETKPDYLLVLPWNLKDEIVQQMAHIKDWGGQFVFAIPALEIL